MFVHNIFQIQDKLNLDPRVERVLRTPKLTGDSDIKDCVNAVQDLHYVLSQQLSQGVQIMQAVSDQKNFFSELSFEFGKKLKVCIVHVQMYLYNVHVHVKIHLNREMSSCTIHVHVHALLATCTVPLLAYFVH